MNSNIFIIFCVIFSPVYSLDGFDSEFNNGLQQYFNNDNVKALQLRKPAFNDEISMQTGIFSDSIFSFKKRNYKKIYIT